MTDYDNYLPETGDFYFDTDEWFPDENAIYDDPEVHPVSDPTDFPPEPTLEEKDPKADITSTGHGGPQAQKFNDRVYYAWLGTCHRGTSSPQIWMAQVDKDGSNWQSRQITTGHAKRGLRFKISEEVGVMHFFWKQSRRDDGYNIRGGACYTGLHIIDPNEGILGIDTIRPSQRTNFPNPRRIRGGGINFHGTYGISEMDEFHGATMYAGIGMGSQARGFVHQGNVVALHVGCAALQNWCLEGTGYNLGGDFLGGPREFAWRRARWPKWGVWHCNTPYEPPLFLYKDRLFWRNNLCFDAVKTTNLDYKDFLSLSICLDYSYYSWRAREWRGVGEAMEGRGIGPGKIITARMCVGNYFEKFNITEVFDGVGRNPDAWHGMVGVKCLDQDIHCPVKNPVQCNKYSSAEVTHGSSIL